MEETVESCVPNSDVNENSSGESQSRSKELALLDLMERTGYNIMQDNGQRKYGGPPPGWQGPSPPRGCEVFVGKIPRDMFEDELVPLFERAGRIYEFRLMMQFSGENRGYGFVMYTERDAAQRAIVMFDNYEIRQGKCIGVCLSLDNCRLFIGSIPKEKTKEEILEEMKKLTDGVVDVITPPGYDEKGRNRHFAFVEYESHKAAAMARRKLIPGTFQLWGNTIQVNWAKPGKSVDKEAMQLIKVLYVRNISETTTEETLHREFSRFKPGSVERVKMYNNNSAFVHFGCREDALTALKLMDGALIDDSKVEVILARPARNKEMSAVRKRNDNSGSQGNKTRGRMLSSCVRTSYDGGDEVRWTPKPRPRSPESRPGISVSIADTWEPTNLVTSPLYPGMPLTPISPLSLKQSQIYSAVSLLEIYCSKNSWSPPEYYLYSTPGREGKMLLVYKVIISSLQSMYMPDRLCLLLDDAKELAARTALFSIESSYPTGTSCYSSRCTSPCNSVPAAASQGYPNFGGGTFAPCCSPLPLTPTLFLPPPPPITPFCPMSTSTP
ncbi:probable RNA-binding protein 46 isoform X1 [Synchiropus splendidus]|uniref:probable RNA-binding protein 46 isoform X1 n=1 Tax=Synchiropus splendidus TaxID=270530 RepID=UPI00237D5689|nr:probable RNA-binding protein 46 isoform X1 [Synchiropus splendidus]